MALVRICKSKYLVECLLEKLGQLVLISTDSAKHPCHAAGDPINIYMNDIVDGHPLGAGITKVLQQCYHSEHGLDWEHK